MPQQKKCRFCRYRYDDKKIPGTVCNNCRILKEAPFGSNFKEHYYGYPSDNKYIKAYVKLKKKYWANGIIFEVSHSLVPMWDENKKQRIIINCLFFHCTCDSEHFIIEDSKVVCVKCYKKLGYLKGGKE